MDAFSLTFTTNTPSFFTTRTQIPSRSFTTGRRITAPQTFPPKNNKFVVFSSKEDPKLDPMDLMELKFGRLIGEDPKLTLAKILGRKANPEASYMDIEKSFYKNKGKLVEIKEVPFDGGKEVQNVQSSSALEGLNLAKPSSSLDGLNLVRPMPKKGVKFEVDVKPRVSEVKNLRRPVAKPIERPNASVPNVILRKPSLYNEDDVEEVPSRLRIKPNLSLKMRQDQPKEQFSDMTLLRKPQPVIVNKEEQGSDAEMEKWIEEANDKVSGFTLLEKLKAFGGETKSEKDNKQFQSQESNAAGNVEDNSFTLLEKPKAIGETKSDNDSERFESTQSIAADKFGDNSFTLLEKPKALGGESKNENDNKNSEGEEASATNIVEDNSFTLLEKPKAIGGELKSENENEQLESEESSEDNNSFKELPGLATTSNATRNTLEESKDGPDQNDDFLLGFQPYEQTTGEDVSAVSELSDKKVSVSNVDLSIDSALQGKPKRFDQPIKRASTKEAETNLVAPERPLSTSVVEGHEDADWDIAENLAKTGDRGDVELISASPRGFVVSFRSLIGFLPYRNLAFKWKFLAFESWLRRKGLDPSLYRRNLGVIGSYDVVNKNDLVGASLEDPDVVINEEKVSPDMKLDDLLQIYDQEKIKFLSSFIGQKIKVIVVLANRKFGKLVFSVKPKEKEESIERKRSLMAQLQVGDVVKCCIKKITYFGVFVEVEGVPALIHQTEISWDATVDPSSYFKVGQIVEAKVYQLDFALERIFLSLKEIMPDPLMGALESVVDDHNSLDGRLEAAQADTEWGDVESLIKELQQTDGIQSVSKGRYFLSPGLAPTFQVYMASMFENQYKLLARSENKVQELIVQASLDKDKMKSVILTCTSRVG